MIIRPKKSFWKKYGVMLAAISVGVIFGILIGKYLVTASGENTSPVAKIGSLAVMLVCLYLAVFLQTILHEAGHLVAGRLSGYEFSSFRIGSMMWIREEGKLRFKKLKIAGTGGQCLMSPPDMVDGTVPVLLYNFGGALMNLAAAVVSCAGWLLCRDVPYVSVFLLSMVFMGIIDALTNGIPLRLGMIDNDGHNALAISKDKEAQRAFCVQLKANAALLKGSTLKDMPEEWFYMPDKEDLKNSITVVMGVFYCNRLIEEHRFWEAAEEILTLLKKDTAMVDLHRNLLICDLIYCELLGDNDAKIVKELLDKEQKNFMKAMKNNPTVLRTEYAYALLGKKDKSEAEKVQKKFDKAALTFPYPADIESERALMKIVDEKFI